MAPISCGSGTLPGTQTSNKNEKRCMPSFTGFIGIKRRSLSTTISDSFDPSPYSNELRRLKPIWWTHAKKRTKFKDHVLNWHFCDNTHSCLLFLLCHRQFFCLFQFPCVLNDVRRDVVHVAMIDWSHRQCVDFWTSSGAKSMQPNSNQTYPTPGQVGLAL